MANDRAKPRARIASTLLVAAVASCLGSACVAVVHDPYSGDRYPESYRSYGCSVPEGHRPPPGQCRIWYPDLPPGQQPPPGDCEELRYHVPPGACLVVGG